VVASGGRYLQPRLGYALPRPTPIASLSVLVANLQLTSIDIHSVGDNKYNCEYVFIDKAILLIYIPVQEGDENPYSLKKTWSVRKDSTGTEGPLLTSIHFPGLTDASARMCRT